MNDSWKLKTAFDALRAGLIALEEEHGVIDAVVADLPDEVADIELVMRGIISRIAHDEAMETARKSLAAQYAQAAQRDGNRAEKARALLHAAMTTMDWTSKVWPEGRLTLSAPRSKVIITDEAKLPDEYVKVERTPMKAEIKKALDAKIEVPGATISNGGDKILSIKF